MKLAQIRSELRGRIDPVLLKVIEAQAEDIRELRHLLKEYGLLMDRLVGLMVAHTSVLGKLEDAEAMRNKAKALSTNVTAARNDVVKSEGIDE